MEVILNSKMKSLLTPAQIEVFQTLILICMWPVTGAVKVLRNIMCCAMWQRFNLSSVWMQTLGWSTVILIFCMCGGLKVPRIIHLPPPWRCCLSPAQTCLCHAVFQTCHSSVRMAGNKNTMGSLQLKWSHKYWAGKQILEPLFHHSPTFLLPETYQNTLQRPRNQKGNRNRRNKLSQYPNHMIW